MAKRQAAKPVKIHVSTFKNVDGEVTIWMMAIEGDQPKRINEMHGRNPYTARNNAKVWKKRIADAIRPFAPEKPLQKAKISAVRYSSNMMDWDGVVSMLKPVLDGLTARKGCGGLIQDDSWKVVGRWGEVDQEYRPRKSGTLLVITVTTC